MKLILSKTQSVAFTGHRSIAPEKVPELRRQVRGKIRLLYMLGFRNFVSGMAMGFDMLAAEEVIKLKEELSELKLRGGLISSVRGISASFPRQMRRFF